MLTKIQAFDFEIRRSIVKQGKIEKEASKGISTELSDFDHPESVSPKHQLRFLKRGGNKSKTHYKRNILDELFNDREEKPGNESSLILKKDV